MFDFSFPELTLILIVALLVVGPERLPRLAREAGMWVGRIRRYAARVQADIRRELESTEFGDIARDLRGAGEEFAHNVNDTVSTLRDSRPLSEPLDDAAKDTEEASPPAAGAESGAEPQPASAEEVPAAPVAEAAPEASISEPTPAPAESEPEPAAASAARVASEAGDAGEPAAEPAPELTPSEIHPHTAETAPELTPSETHSHATGAQSEAQHPETGPARTIH